MSDRKESLIIFHADLDNTLIYSYKHEIGEEKRNVEVYKDREISFMTEKSSSLLKLIRERVCFVPTTTRTEEQYGRIDLGLGVPDYALVCNGGILLKGTDEVSEWYEESLGVIENSREEFLRAFRILQEDPFRNFEVRNIRDLFLFTKSRMPAETAERMKRELNPAFMGVFSNGNKVYTVPKGLDKGHAVRRFRDYIKADMVIAAGDSEFDIPMLEEADMAYAPEELRKRHNFSAHVTEISADRIFSDVLLEKILEKLSVLPGGTVSYK